MDARPRKSGSRTKSSARRLELLAGAVAAALVAALIGYLVWRGIAETDPPAFTVAVERIVRSGDRHHVAFRIANTGDAAAAEVVVQGRVGTEESEATLDVVPPHGERRGVLIFAADPARGLDIGVRAYVEP